MDNFGVLVTDDFIEREYIDPREDQSCWCPDSFLEIGMHVMYCPRHGSQPEPELMVTDGEN